MPETFIIQQKCICVHHGLLLQQHFYSHPLLLYAHYLTMLTFVLNKYIFGFNPANSLIATTPVLSFILPTTYLFESS